MRRLLTPRLVALHVAAVGFTVAFAWLGWWQLSRGLSSVGSLRNLAYALQWPIFAAFVVFLWWRMVRDELAPPQDPPAPHAALEPPVPPAAYDDSDDPELAAYNRYLADLADRSGRR